MNQFTILLAALFTLCFFSACQEKPALPYQNDGTEKHYESSAKPFYHGVASGDPLVDRVIIWTRVTPELSNSVSVSWVMASDKEMSNKVAEGVASTDSTRDYTVKVDVSGLEAGKTYYYQFSALDSSSPIGRTKTLPTGQVDKTTLAIVSCSNWEFGYFNAFGRIAELDQLDAVLHLGDYIYEYAPGGYGDTSIGRTVLPPKEILSLQDYRTRYALYHLDKDFQLAHQAHPFICIWDDHEITNDSYATGAQNHQPDEEGDYEVRKKIARQVYFEWLPVRDNPGNEIYREKAFGNLVDLIMLDERLAGRSPQLDSITDPDYNSSERSMLGSEQLSWFKEKLQNSKATWKVIGNQVIFSDLDLTAVFPDASRNLDAWDGYPAEKKDLLGFFEAQSLENLLIVTGDTHCSWAFEVPRSIQDYQQTGKALAVEFGAPSISSANYDEYTSIDTVRYAEAMFRNFNPQLKYVNLSDHGYVLLHITPDSTSADWFFVETLRTRNKEQRLGKSVVVKSGETKMSSLVN